MDNKNEILYTYKNNVYLNITNACPCKCEFCIRSTTDTVGESGSLWLNHSPDFNEVRSAIDSFDFTGYDEAIFCGYGEPTCAFDVLIKTAEYLREKGIRTRLNTNGLSDLINKRSTAEEICKNIGSVSISLNASDKVKYNDIVHPSFGIISFDAMLSFAKECRKHTENVAFTVVDVIGEEEIEKCRKIAEECGVNFRVRVYSAD